MEQRTGSQGREAFNSQKSHMSHPTRCLTCLEGNPGSRGPLKIPGLLGPEIPQPCKHIIGWESPELHGCCVMTSPASVTKPLTCNERARGTPCGGRQRPVRLVPACSIPPPLAPPADSWGVLASYQGPPARHQHTSPLAAPSAQSRPLFLAPNWLREVGHKGGVGVPHGLMRHCKGPPHLMPHDPHLETEKQRQKEPKSSSTTHPLTLGEQVEAQRGNGTCPRSHSRLKAQAGLQAQLSWPDCHMLGR